MTLNRIEMRSREPPRFRIMSRLSVFILIMILSLAVVLVPSARAAPPVAGDWLVQTVDSQGDVGMYSSIALDSSSGAYISYHNNTAHTLKYATNSGGLWSYETVDSVGDVGEFSAIAVDSNKNVHISYYDNTTHEIKYATNAGGSWSTTVVDKDGNGSWYDPSGRTSIAVDSNGFAYISYLDFINGDLKYATNSGGSWSNTTVDSIGDVGGYSSIALDSAKHVYIGYYDFSHHDLKYATNAGGSWSTAVVDGSGHVGGFSSMAMDSKGKAHFSYYDNNSQDLKYATNAGGSWTNVTVDSGGTIGLYTSIAVDSNDKAHISYYDNSTNLWDLKYATNAGGSWTNVTVDNTSYVGRFTSIAIDPIGKAHISYYDWENGDLKYAAQASEPSAPRNLIATAGNSSIGLTWSAPSISGSSPITNYTIYRGTTSGGESLLTKIGVGTSYIDDKVTIGQIYYYEVSAVNAVGVSSQSNEASATIAVPATVPTAPQNLNAVVYGTQVNLTWSAPSSTGGSAITGYNVYRNDTLIATLGDVHSYADTGLTSGQTYHYAVSAVNSVGESTPSAQTVEVQVTPNIAAGNNSDVTWIVLIVAIVAIAGICIGLLYLRKKISG